MATIKSKNASRPALLPGELSCTYDYMFLNYQVVVVRKLKLTRKTWYPSVPPPGISILSELPIFLHKN